MIAPIRVASLLRTSEASGALSRRGLKATPYRRCLPCAAVIAALALAVTPAAQQSASRATPVIAEARQLIDKGQARAAIDRLKAFGEPTPVEVIHLLGVAYYHADDHVRAIEQLTTVVGKLPEGSVERREAIQVLGLSHFIVGHFAEAVPFLEATRVWAADNPELGYVLGQTYVQVRQPDRARATFARTFGLAAESAAAHLIAAQMMIRLDFEDFAETELKRAIEKDPKLPQAHALLGQLAMFRGRLDEAISLTEREIALNPGNAMALAQLGDALVRQSKWDDAVVALQKSIWLNPFYSAPYILLGKAYMKKEQPATAEGMLQRAIQYDPNNRAAHYLLGQLFQQTGRPAEAKREFDIAERLQGQPGR
jgi:tetratricopeptide (TPR) repeat protein